MSKERLFRLLLTTGQQEEVVAVLVQRRYPNELGEITPPITVRHEGQEYILKRKWMQDVYVYQPLHRSMIDDFLAPPPTE